MGLLLVGILISLSKTLPLESSLLLGLLIGVPTLCLIGGGLGTRQHSFQKYPLLYARADRNAGGDRRMVGPALWPTSPDGQPGYRLDVGVRTCQFDRDFASAHLVEQEHQLPQPHDRYCHQ